MFSAPKDFTPTEQSPAKPKPICLLPSSTTSFSFSTASAKRATTRSSEGMSSTSMMEGVSATSDCGLWAMAARPWPLLNTHDWRGKPAALACRLRAVGLFSVPTGDGHPTSLVCWAEGVPGQLGPSTTEGHRVAGLEEEEAEVLESVWSFRGCSWRMDSWGEIRETRGKMRKMNQQENLRQGKPVNPTPARNYRRKSGFGVWCFFSGDI